ncbi:hypothetical protein BGZ61DRAFT_567901 [Ilyonectria robusta]|uniref:uncharacterized protein n=1 Tax=Ilyonectria robusta TaxID=1079257 RepID=UPI001E8EAEE8|nr:uncharacterized protein BGZ61DRAFT_567901 [Ilyonectria robusta]KAH8657240.1 hypothetical protein BGZ61DRAFT_567901 [Ilyonectria robusta]
MSPPKIPPEHVYCVQAGKKHHELFTTTYVGANYCGRCGLANPFRLQHQARSKTPALPGPYDEVVEVEDSPPRPVSPASQLLRERPKPVSFISIGRTAQLLPNEVSAPGTVNTRARIPPPEAPGNPHFMTVASAASRAIQDTKTSARKPMRQRTGYQWVHISLLLVSLETRYFNGLAVEVPETVLPLKDTVIKFSSSDLLTWPSFTAILFDYLRPLPPTIDLTNRDLWSLSYASSFSGKKIVTVPNTDKYTTPSSMLASGHFGNNQAGQLKVLVVLTSTDVVDKQEPVTPLRPDEYSTPVKEEKKRKVKQEDPSPAPRRKKRIKQEEHVKKESRTGDTYKVKQGVHIKVKPEEPVPTASRQSPTDDELEDIVEEIIVHEDVADLCEVEDPLRDLLFDGIPGDKGSGGMAGDGDVVDGGDDEEILVPEFVTREFIAQSINSNQARLPGTDIDEALPPARSTRFKGTKIPAIFAVRHNRKD